MASADHADSSLDAGPDGQDVRLYELSDRVGGRVISLDPPEMPGLKAEFGGMRFLTNQPLVCNLVETLGLTHRPFPVSGDENIYYVRGTHLRHADLTDPDRVPYALSRRERGKTPGELIMEAIDTIIPEGALRTAEDGLRTIFNV